MHNPLAVFKTSGNVALRLPLKGRIVGYLDSLPYKHVVTRAELQAALSPVAIASVDMTVSLAGMQPYRCRYGKGYLYGNKETIAELKRRLNQE